MTKEKFEKIKKRFWIMDDEVENVIEFVHELLCAKSDEIKENEPYATKIIGDLDKAAYEVFNLIYDIENIEEDDE